METWDYNGWKNFNDRNNFNYLQNDWNQTIITVFNLIVIENIFDSTNKPNVTMIVPKKFKKLFKSLLLYIKNKIITPYAEFTVEFIDSKDNKIMVGEIPLEILNKNETIFGFITKHH